MGKKSKKSKRNKEKEQALPLEDRFAAAETRPQFRAPKQSSTKVVLDERFSSVLTDPRFQLEEKDKYGRKKKKNKDGIAATEELKAFYVVKNNDFDDDENNNDDQFKDQEGHDKSEAQQKPSQDDADASTSDSSEEEGEGKKVKEPASRIAYLTALSRGELDVSSSSGEDDSSQSSDEDDDEADGEDPVYGTAGVLDPSFNEAEQEVEISCDPSPYLAVTNMDWENTRAVDLFSVLSSFAPPGAVKTVQVYQSDFGIEKMEKDKLYGPTGIWKKNKSKQNHDHDDEEESQSSNGSDSDSDNQPQQGEQQEGSDVEENEEVGLKIQFEQNEESDFDPEKLRAYEASKLKYFFAVVEFSKPEHADLVYREVDGMEFERSSSAMDLRTIPVEEVPNVITDRPLRDEASGIPGNYQPPEFVVSALQQTNVQCTWDQGDTERERKLTKYASAGWREEHEHDDLKAYLASDASSDEDSDREEKESENVKGSKMRKLLGLDSDEDDSEGSNSLSSDDDNDDDDDGDSDSDASINNESMSKEIKFVPGQKSLEEKIRHKLESNKEKPKELTPWEKYQEKRKQKRKERRQAARGLKKREQSDDSSDEGGRFGVHKSRQLVAVEKETDDFFLDDHDDETSEKLEAAEATNEQKSREELELLLAGEHNEEQARDYDIRGIQRMEKNKGKKLKGSRKRKEAKIAADVSGTDFQVDVHDTRFNAVLDGSDDRFGIDKTDPNFKDTSAMREILSEQTKRRKKKRKKSNASADVVVPDVNSHRAGKTSGASALSSLVQRLKSRVESS